MLSRLLAFLYPPRCLACGAFFRSEGEFSLCSGCIGLLVPLSPNRCPACAIPFASPVTLSRSPDHRCGDCRKRPPRLSRSLIPFVYAGPLVKAIHNLKYRKKSALARSLSSLLIRTVSFPPIDVVVPIPLHPGRLREREFNQAALLARPLSKHLGKPLLIDSLLRLRPTIQQVGLTREERMKNVRGAFSVRRPDRIKGSRVLLVDDVLTTGATFNAAARALKRAGAKEVIACALAPGWSERVMRRRTLGTI